MDLSCILNSSLVPEKGEPNGEKKRVEIETFEGGVNMEVVANSSGPQEKLYYSMCFERFHPLSFYGNLLQKVLAFAQTFDEGTLAYRDRVWTILDSLYRIKLPRDKELLFSPLISKWLLANTIHLFALELLYVAFMFVTSDAYISAKAPQAELKEPPFSPFGHTIPEIMNQLRLVTLINRLYNYN
jgi:hypothetical protein